MPPALDRLGQLDVPAASGVVCGDGRLFVVPDDDLALAEVDLATLASRARHPLWPGVLPDEPKARKAAKPDGEALVRVPDLGLLVLGSGSRPTRRRGALLPWTGRGPLGAPRAVDLAPLHAALAGELPELNLEGAAVAGDRLRLLQRRSGPDGVNALVDLDLAGVVAALREGAALTASLVRAIVRVELPSLAGVPLGFTDASGLPDGRVLFVAAAEASPDAYDDGAVAGSAVGLLAPDGAVLVCEPLGLAEKVEGVHAEPQEGGGFDLVLVADADDRRVPSPVWRGRWQPA